MRHFKNFMILFMALTLGTFTSCSSDDDSGDGGGDPGAPTGALVATIDGAGFQSAQISSSATLANNGQNLIIIATNSQGRAINISILQNYTGPGTYDIGGGLNIFTNASYSETDVDLNNPQNSTTEIWQAPYEDAVAGTVTISEETDSNVKGTFEFMCKNTGGDQSVKTITGGSFDLGKQVVN